MNGNRFRRARRIHQDRKYQAKGTQELHYRLENEIVADLREICASPGYIHVLAHISFRDNFIAFGEKMTSKAMEKSYASSRLVRTELSTLIGFMLRSPMNDTLPLPTIIQQLLERTETLLEELHDCLARPMSITAQDKTVLGKDGDELARGEVLREPIFYGGDSAYIFQYRDLAVKRYANDEVWLRANKGFSIEDASVIASALIRVQERKMFDTLESLRTLPASMWTLLPGFEIRLDEIAEEAKTSEELASLVVAALTSPETPTNSNFQELGDFNIATATPVLQLSSERSVVLDSFSIVEALYDSPFYWMVADQNYKNKACAHRGNFTETYVESRLSSVFGVARVHRGVNLEKSSRRIGEIDVLVLFADRAIVVQCKSKKMTIEARKGNDLRLRDDFKKSVQDAYDQAFLCAHALHEGTARPLLSDGDELIIPKLREIYIICAVADHYPALAFQCHQMLKFESTDIIKSPIITDVFMIDVLAEMLPSPLRFLSYLNRRAEYGDRVASSNEHAILSYHLKQNLWIEEGTDLILLADDIAIDLDTAMTIRREGLPGSDSVDGVWQLLQGTIVGKILTAIERIEDPSLIDLGFRLLTLGGKTINRLSQGINQITRQTRHDGGRHDFTIGLGNGAGITVHSNPAPNNIVAATLAGHCERRKYVQRADAWFGLAVRAEDGLPKLGIHLRYPWRQNDELDRLTSHMQVGTTSHPDLHRVGKVGRNDPCFCGSGQKYKRCCLQ